MATRVYGGKIVSFPVAATTTITDNELVCINGDGFIVTASDTSGIFFIGVADQTVSNINGGDGDLNVNVYVNCTIDVTLDASLLNSALDIEVFISDSTTVKSVGSVSAGELRYIADSGLTGYIITPIYQYYDSPLIGAVSVSNGIIYTNNRTDFRYELARNDSFPIAAGENIIKNTLVALLGGFLYSATDTAGLLVIGKALYSKDNTLGIDGALNVDVLQGGKEYFDTNGLVMTDCGHTCYVNNATTLTTQAISVNKIQAGILMWVNVATNRGLLRF